MPREQDPNAYKEMIEEGFHGSFGFDDDDDDYDDDYDLDVEKDDARDDMAYDVNLYD